MSMFCFALLRFRNRLLLRDPQVDLLFQHVQRQRARIDYLIVELADIELAAELFLRPRLQFQYLQLTHFVRERLGRPRDISIGFGLNARLVNRRMVMEILHNLLTRPVLVVQSGIDDQPNRAQHLIFQAPKIAVRILIEPDFLPEPLGIQRPTLTVGAIPAMLPECRQILDLLRDGALQMVARNALVVSGRFNADHRALFRLTGIYLDVPGTRSVWRARNVLRSGSILLAELLHWHHDQVGLRQTPEQLRQFGFHLRQILPIEVQNLLSRLRIQLGVRLDRLTERLQVLKSQAIGDCQLLLLNLRDLLQSDLVNFLRRLVRGGGMSYPEGINRIAVGERPHANLGPSFGSVFILHEGRELRVRG